MNEHLKERDLWWPVSPELMTSYRDGSHTKDIGSALFWYKNNFFHRDGDKPAVIYADGTLEWFINGIRHRVTGPAAVNPNKKHEYWIDGVEITKEVNAWLKTRKYKVPFTPEQQVEFALTFS